MDGTTGYPDDDLPRFRSSPPGTPRPAGDGDSPGPGTTPAAAPVEAAGRSAVAPRRRRTRVVVASAVTVLLLCGVVTAVVLSTRQSPGTAPRAAAPSSSPAAPTSSPAPAPLPAQPAQPSPGDPGAGALAGTDLPVGPGGVAARVAAAGLVLARAPAGVTAGFPRVAVTADGDRAVLHLTLPVANCLSATAPARPEDGGCQPGASEYADLATPALQMSADGDRLVLTGHVPTYLRPAGAPPVWTGRAYEVTVTVDLPAPHGDAPVPSDGSVTIAGQTAPALPGDALTTVVYGR